MKLRLATLSLLLLAVAPTCLAGPFGLDAGMSRDDVIQRIGRNFVVTETTSSVVFNTVPVPNSHFSSYNCFFAKNGKLAAVVASSPPIAIPLANGFLTTYEFLKIDLEDRYGKAAGVIAYRGSREKWQECVKTKKQIAAAVWDGHNDKLFSSHLSGIALTAQPVDGARCVLTLAYDFRVFEEPGL